MALAPSSSSARITIVSNVESLKNSSENLEKNSLMGRSTSLSYLFGNYVVLTSEEEMFVYDVRSKDAKTVDIQKIVEMNGVDSKFFCLKPFSGDKAILCYGSSIMSFDGFEISIKYGSPTGSASILGTLFKTETFKILDLGSNRFLVGSTRGLRYTFDNSSSRSFYDLDKPDESINGAVRDIAKLDAGLEAFKFYVAQNGELFEVTNLKDPQYSKILQLGSNATINSIYGLQNKEYVFSTTNGVYVVDNLFHIVDDLNRFTLENLYKMINEQLKKMIEDHVKKDHASDSIITLLNKKSSNVLPFLASTDKHVDKYRSDIANSVKIIENDVIKTIEKKGWSKSDKTNVKVAFRNWATGSIKTEATYSDDGFVSKFTDPSSGKVFDISTVPYICKHWMSGLKEIYVYVPSTATYYINNPRGISNSQYSYMSLSRKNVNGVNVENTLQDACTTLRVYLYNDYFNIKTILAAQCTGNSLPLKIYKDSTNAEDSWKGFFDTAVQPSVLRTLPRTNDRNVNNVRVCTDSLNRIVLDFSIYGTDAQAIRIIAES